MSFLGIRENRRVFSSGAEYAIVPFRGCRFYCGPGNKIEAALRLPRDRHGREGYDRLNFSIIDSIVNKGDVLFDIGANIGVYTCVLGRLSGAGTNIHAFEPADHIRRKLLRNLKLNGIEGVSVNSFGLGAAETESKFFEVKEGNFRGGVSSFVRNENIERMNESSFIERCVQVRMLDNYVSEASPPKVNFLKIDVEGFEWEVLRGGIKTMDGFRPFILMEYDEIRHGKHASEMLSLFKDLQYEALEPFLERGKLGFSRWSFDRTPKERNVLLMP